MNLVFTFRFGTMKQRYEEVIMNYKKIYSNFIKCRKEREFISGYTEKHHIKPKSLGGGDEEENLVELTAKEHYFAHRVLSKIYGGSMHIAIYRMAHPMSQGSKNRRKVSSREYEVLRENRANVMSDLFKGVPRTEEVKANISKALKGRVFTDEWRNNMSIAKTGMKRGPMKEEQRKEISRRMTGDGNHRYGKPTSERQKRAVSEASKGEKSHRYDKKIYKFINKQGETRECTKYELRNEFNLSHSNLSMVCSGQRKSVMGWMINE